MNKKPTNISRDVKIPFESEYPILILESTLNLKNIDVKVKKGSLVVIVGETGSGKSSLLQAIAGEMIHVPQSVIEAIDVKSKMTDVELRALEETLLNKDFIGASPIKIRG